jgi:hypothetical protein
VARLSSDSASREFNGRKTGVDQLPIQEIRRTKRALAMANFHVHRASGEDLVQAGREGLRLDLLLGMEDEQDSGLPEPVVAQAEGSNQ